MCKHEFFATKKIFLVAIIVFDAWKKYPIITDDTIFQPIATGKMNQLTNHSTSNDLYEMC